jgi:hypothetical protein
MPTDLDPTAVDKTLAGIDARVAAYDDLMRWSLQEGERCVNAARNLTP